MPALLAEAIASTILVVDDAVSAELDERSPERRFTPRWLEDLVSLARTLPGVRR